MNLPSSDDEILLLHNPRCSKSRAALALLEERGADFSVRAYLEEPLTEAELRAVAERLGQPIGSWVRKQEKAYAAIGLGDAPNDAQLIAAVAEEPILMERPILLRGERAAIGRPTENLLDLL